MEDELTKHTRKIITEIRNPKHSMSEKAKEIITEVCIIVFAVTLSIWLHGWSEHRHEQAEAYSFLTGLKSDLAQDIKLLEDHKSVALKIDSNFAFLIRVKNLQVHPSDTVLYNHLYFETRTTHPNIGRYAGFKSSGKINTIENDSLKQNILTFYEQTIPDLVDGESYTNDLQRKILDLQIERPDNVPVMEFLTSKKIRSMFDLGTQNFRTNLQMYGHAIALAKKITAEIDQEKH